jgi:phage repressor protein C with HTH and peptisase S24 domain
MMMNTSAQDTSSVFSSEFEERTRKWKNFGERLKGLREELGLTQPYLAGKVGVSLGSVQNYERGKLPLGEHLVNLAAALGCSIDWLLTGEGPINRTGEGTVSQPCDSDLVMVPKVVARLSAGTGSLETSAEIKARYAFRREWITVKGHPGRMVLMDVTGDSMEPAIWENDVVLIDQAQQDVLAGKIYAVGIDEEVLIKFVDKEPGKYILRSANERYRSIEIDLKDESLNVRIIGRVVWWCREAR